MAPLWYIVLPIVRGPAGDEGTTRDGTSDVSWCYSDSFGGVISARASTRVPSATTVPYGGFSPHLPRRGSSWHPQKIPTLSRSPSGPTPKSSGLDWEHWHILCWLLLIELVQMITPGFQGLFVLGMLPSKHFGSRSHIAISGVETAMPEVLV